MIQKDGRLDVYKRQVTFFVSILSIFFDVAYESYLPSLIGRDQLIEGNSKFSASASLAEVSGLGLAGWLVQLFTAPVTILIDALSFVVSAISVWLVRVPEQAQVPGFAPVSYTHLSAGRRLLAPDARTACGGDQNSVLVNLAGQQQGESPARMETTLRPEKAD